MRSVRSIAAGIVADGRQSLFAPRSRAGSGKRFDLASEEFATSMQTIQMAIDTNFRRRKWRKWYSRKSKNSTESAVTAKSRSMTAAKSGQITSSPKAWAARERMIDQKTSEPFTMSAIRKKGAKDRMRQIQHFVLVFLGMITALAVGIVSFFTLMKIAMVCSTWAFK